MKLSEVFASMDKKYNGYKAVVYQGNNSLIGGVFCSLKDYPKLYHDYELADEHIPSEVNPNRKELVFRVK